MSNLPARDADACPRCGGGGVEPGATWRCGLCFGSGRYLKQLSQKELRNAIDYLRDALGLDRSDTDE